VQVTRPFLARKKTPAGRAAPNPSITEGDVRGTACRRPLDCAAKINESRASPTPPATKTGLGGWRRHRRVMSANRCYLRHGTSRHVCATRPERSHGHMAGWVAARNLRRASKIFSKMPTRVPRLLRPAAHFCEVRQIEMLGAAPPSGRMPARCRVGSAGVRANAGPAERDRRYRIRLNRGAVWRMLHESQ
jgi:hypothetical protein